MDKLIVKRLSGKEVIPYIPTLANLRIQIFRNYPYLYEGDLEYEKKYLQKYVNSPNSVLIAVFAGDRIVGVSTAIPLSDETNETKTPFIQANFDLTKIFYFGESVLLPEYRGQHIGEIFFRERETAAREHHCTYTTFCAVERLENDPKRPLEWHSLERFWQRLGYVKHPELQTFYSWQEIGEKTETLKPMTFWMKQL